MNADTLDGSTIEKIKDFGFEGEFLNINKPILKRQSNGKFACDKCKFETVKRCDIKRHKDAVHVGVKYRCNQCTVEYGSEELVKGHIDSVHNGHYNNCNLCAKKFEQPKALKRHIKVFHEGIITVSKCKECDKTFKHHSAMRYHIQKDHKDEMYPCDQCKYSAKVKKNLRLHQKNMHSEYNTNNTAL